MMMKRFCLISVCVLWVSVCAQSSYLGKLPYVDENPDARKKLLDVHRLLVTDTNRPVEVDARWPSGVKLTGHEEKWVPKLLKAREADRAGENEKALKGYQSFVEFNEGHEVALLWTADLLFTMKRYQEAETLYRELIERVPGNFMIQNNLGWLYATAEDMRVRNGERALRYARQALLTAPENYHVWSTVAEAHYVRGQYEEALHAAGEAVRLAEKQEATDQLMTYYIKQVDMARLAKQAMSIME